MHKHNPDFEVAITGRGDGRDDLHGACAGTDHRDPLFSGRQVGTMITNSTAIRVEVRQAVHDEYHDLIVKQSRALRYYFNDLKGHVPTYYRNSQGDSTYAHPTGFFAASRANRQFSFDDYHHEQ